MKQRRFRIHPSRDYVIHVCDSEKNLIATIRDSGFYNIQQILNEAARVGMGPRTPKYITISCQETEEFGIYGMGGKRIL